jgi:hypothetical protein
VAGWVPLGAACPTGNGAGGFIHASLCPRAPHAKADTGVSTEGQLLYELYGHLSNSDAATFIFGAGFDGTFICRYHAPDRDLSAADRKGQRLATGHPHQESHKALPLGLAAFHFAVREANRDGSLTQFWALSHR